MKRFTLIVALVFSIILAGGCANPLPKPVNANGSASPTVAVAEAWVTYTNATRFATTYVATCHAVPSTKGCSAAVVTQLKAASNKALNALEAAQQAVNTLPTGASGIDAALADLNAALVFLQAIIRPLPNFSSTTPRLTEWSVA